MRLCFVHWPGRGAGAVHNRHEDKAIGLGVRIMGIGERVSCQWSGLLLFNVSIVSGGDTTAGRWKDQSNRRNMNRSSTIQTRSYHIAFVSFSGQHRHSWRRQHRLVCRGSHHLHELPHRGTHECVRKIKFYVIRMSFISILKADS